MVGGPLSKGASFHRMDASLTEMVMPSSLLLSLTVHLTFNFHVTMSVIVRALKAKLHAFANEPHIHAPESQCLDEELKVVNLRYENESLCSDSNGKRERPTFS